ncbi:MAG: thiolase family protein [Bacteroidia bacterium]|nr:thiolase family protein [Bacteroidia bacterium]MDG2041529.1 thiolase family protein [Bacteroidia bacterium]|tara:strand:- start:1118 stop:2296 length:1179 start_codon:yes stop_codon:yes gene_type:complete
MNRVYIVAAVRTPMGSFNGMLRSVSAPKLGATAIKGAISKSGINSSDIDEVYFGNVLQAGVGQAPARQAAILAGLPESTPCTTVNKVCASGMKSIALGASSIMLGHNEIIAAGGMENMSQVPHYIPNSRMGHKYGDFKAIDGLAYDGLRDVYNQYMMGTAADLTAKKYNITREEQDNFAVNSYKQTAESWDSGKFTEEVVPVPIPQRKGDPIIMIEDEEYKNVNFDKIPKLRPVFDKEGTVTAANASTINDGAACIILASEKKVKELGLKPMAEVLSFADAAHQPELFTTAPSVALPIALERAGCSIDEVDAFELNEAFSVVGLVNNKLLNLDPSKVNINGGAVSMGHPLGASGARIVVTLLHVLKQNNGDIGAAAICNGGGGASAMVIKNI